MSEPVKIKALLASCGGWHLPHTARALEAREALAELWLSLKRPDGVPDNRYRRCWPFHLAMKPFYHFASQILMEKAFYSAFPAWKHWVLAQKMPETNVVHAITGYATEFFDSADASPFKILKVVDCPNSHPATLHGIWQRECDIWCPGEKIPIPQWMFARMNRELRRADLVIVQSAFCKESMVQNGIPADRVFVNPMGVDTTTFKKREMVPVRPRFICVATICLRKGHQYLFRAFERVKKELPDAELICVGDYKCDFRKEQKRWEGTFTHYPQLDHQALAALLRECTAFVFPSQEEGIARAQIEALASGLPVIGTHEGGATTLVSDDEEGFIVPGQNPQMIADAMIRIATDPDRCKQMGEAAYKKGSINNTWQDYGDRLLTAYETQLNWEPCEEFSNPYGQL